MLASLDASSLQAIGRMLLSNSVAILKYIAGSVIHLQIVARLCSSEDFWPPSQAEAASALAFPMLKASPIEADFEQYLDDLQGDKASYESYVGMIRFQSESGRAKLTFEQTGLQLPQRDDRLWQKEIWLRPGKRLWHDHV